MPRGSIRLTVAQLTNASAVPGSTPSIAHFGLPFGDNAALSPPVTIRGSIFGIRDFSGLTLVYFAFDDGTGKWLTGPDWVCAIKADQTYTASLPRTAHTFAAVLMRSSYWSKVVGSAAKGSTVSVEKFPTAESNPGDVVLSTEFSAALGRSFRWGIFSTGLQRIVLAPGYIHPMGGQTPLLHVEQNDGHGPSEYKIDGRVLKPTDPDFIRSLIQQTINRPVFHPIQKPSRPPSGGSFDLLLLEGVSLDPNRLSGYLCVIIYQDHGGGLYLLSGYEGPNAPMVTEGCEIFGANPLRKADLELAITFSVCSDRVFLNIVSASIDVNKSAAAIFLGAYFKAIKSLAGILFGI